jgi:UDP-glucose 4-epimerase
MRVLVTGSAGHLGEALMRTLQSLPHEAVGLDTRRSDFTHRVGSITQRAFGSKGYHFKQFTEGPYPTE